LNPLTLNKSTRTCDLCTWNITVN